MLGWINKAGRTDGKKGDEGVGRIKERREGEVKE